MSKEKKPLTPPDPFHCQADKPNGHSFMTLGGQPGMVECKDPPSVIVYEIEAGEDGRAGSMSMCKVCFKVFKKKVGLDNVVVFYKKRGK